MEIRIRTPVRVFEARLEIHNFTDKKCGVPGLLGTAEDCWGVVTSVSDYVHNVTNIATLPKCRIHVDAVESD